MERRGSLTPSLVPIRFGVNPVFRVGLSVYLMFATLAGSWLCCCRSPRLIHDPVDWVRFLVRPSSIVLTLMRMV